MNTKIIRLNKNLFVSYDFFQFLLNANCNLNSLILNLATNEDICYITNCESSDMVKYLQKSKVEDIETIPENIDRLKLSQMKVGRLISKLFNKEILDDFAIKDYSKESFVNNYKSWFDKSGIVFKIVEGEEIRKWYYQENYSLPDGEKKGSLWKSCMRYKEKLDFIDIYCKNDKIKMLCLLIQENGEEKVRARALLWHDVDVLSSKNLSGKINLMDRIYYTLDSDVPLFKSWAFKHDYITKWEQNAKSHQFFDQKGELIKMKLEFKLSEYQFDYYPYLDTFPFFSYRDATLSNDEYNPKWQYKLVQTDGTLYKQEQDDEEEYIPEDEW
jgi:hypothetical protein